MERECEGMSVCEIGAESPREWLRRGEDTGLAEAFTFISVDESDRDAAEVDDEAIDVGVEVDESTDGRAEDAECEEEESSAEERGTWRDERGEDGEGDGVRDESEMRERFGCRKCEGRRMW